MANTTPQNDYRSKATKILDAYVNCKIGFGLDDLPDTSEVMNTIDEIESILESFEVDCTIGFRRMSDEVKSEVSPQLHDFDLDALVYG